MIIRLDSRSVRATGPGSFVIARAQRGRDFDAEGFVSTQQPTLILIEREGLANHASPRADSTGIGLLKVMSADWPSEMGQVMGIAQEHLSVN
jgi:hypothetical protein